MSDQFVREADPDAVFAALADESRIAILQSLRASSEPAVSFSTLQDAVGIDDSGRFNYHLGTLTDRFVRRTDDGYELTQAGKHVVGAIESGSYTARGEIGPIRLEEPCRVCGETQHLSYRNERVTVACTSCPSTFEFPVPPVVFADCDRAAVPRLASRYLRTTVRRQYDGFCSHCNGCLTRTVAPGSEFESAAILPDELFDVDASGYSLLVEFDCQQCGATAFSNPEDVLVEHPSVLGFYDDHGIDARERCCWAFPSLDDFDASVVSDAPPRFEVTYSCGGESLSLRVDDRLSVLETGRRPATD